MKRIVIYLFLSLSLLLNACEYELGENYIELEKPSAEEQELNITLNLFAPDGDERYVMTYTKQMEYEVKVPGYRIGRCVFSMGNKRWELNRDDRHFTIDVNEFPNNIYELSCEVYGQRLDGSVGGLAIEHLVGKKTWSLRVLVRDSSNKPLPPYWINENGDLVVSWTIDEKQREAFDHYEVCFFNPSGGSLTNIVSDFNVRTCIYYLSYDPLKYDLCEVFFYPKDVTARPYSLGRAWLYDLKGAELSNPANLLNK